MQCEKFTARWNPARTTAHRMAAYRKFLAHVLVRLDHVVRFIVNANDSIM